MKRAACISPCGRYRYWLDRQWGADDGKIAVFVMLNPSTADAAKDDPTIRKCIGFAKRWGLHALRVVNLFAWRATDPRELSIACEAGHDIVGPANGDAIETALYGVAEGGAGVVIAAWGAVPPGMRAELHEARVRSFEIIAKGFGSAVSVKQLGQTMHGQPRHPLMMKYGPWIERAP